MPSDFENNDDFEAYRQEIDERTDYDETKKQRLLDEMHEIVQNERNGIVHKINTSHITSDDSKELSNQPYIPASEDTDKEKRRNVLHILKKWETVAAAFVLVAALFFCMNSIPRSTLLKSAQAPDGSQTDSLSETSGITESTEQTSIRATTQETENNYVTKATAPLTTTATSRAAITTVSPKSTTFSHDDSSSDVTHYIYPQQGILWMSIGEMQSKIDTLYLCRYYDQIESETGSVPSYNLDFNKFYDIMKIIKNYNWTEHRQGFNVVKMKACEICVIGNNTVYTYLQFGRDESGRCFVWSFYDYQIAYLSEQDYGYIEDIFLNAG